MRNRQTRAAYREHNRGAGMLWHLFAGDNMMASLWTYSTLPYNANNISRQRLLSSQLRYNNWPYFHYSFLLIINLLKQTMHCFMLHCYYQRNVLFFLPIKDFITSAVLGSRLTLILTCLFNQVPNETSSLLQALARRHWETYAKFIFSK